jgi:transcription-repair coupling factor (superfamily II helicase)
VASCVAVERRRLSKAIDSFTDLREGDLVVHLEHGIGRFGDWDILDRNASACAEHLEMEFFGGDADFVPTTKNRFDTEICGRSEVSSTIGQSRRFSLERQKKAAAEAVAELAKEMLEMQAITLLASRHCIWCGHALGNMNSSRLFLSARLPTK